MENLDAKQRTTNTPVHYRDKLKTPLDDLQEHGILKQSGSMPHEKPNYGTNFLNSLIIAKKNDSIENLLVARHFNSNTDQSSESWPLEVLAIKLARANKKYKSAIDLLYTYAHATVVDESIKLTGFSSNDKLLLSIEVFGTKFFTQQFFFANF